jgi:hypothetical protein
LIMNNKSIKIACGASFIVICIVISYLNREISNVIGIIFLLAGIAKIYYDADVEEKKSKELPSYRLELIIEPHWFCIFEKILPGLEEGEEFLVAILLSKLNKDAGKTLNDEFANNYHNFVYFYNKTSIDQIWHDGLKTFVKELDVEIRLISYGFSDSNKISNAIDKLATENIDFSNLISKPNMKDNLIKLFFEDYKQIDFYREGKYFRIHPWLFGEIVANFAIVGPIRDIVDGEKIASIPLFNLIIPFLHEVNSHTSSGAMKAIKTFPKNIQEKFTKNQITYFDESRLHNIEYSSERDFFDSLEENIDKKWADKRGVELYSSRMNHHWFSTNYFSLGIQIEFYEEYT